MNQIYSLIIDQTDFVLAVSGGVDSMVLLDILRRQKAASEFVVAHLDHGIRDEQAANMDKNLVTSYCKKHGLRIEIEAASLGDGASELEARTARYEFFERVKTKYNYNIVITAHHKDDVLETAIINILRGTGSKGLVSLTNKTYLARPLLEFTKKQILEYAEANELEWNEDSTNSDEAMLRNYIRLNIMPRLMEGDGYGELSKLIEQQKPRQLDIDVLVDELTDLAIIRNQDEISINRKLFIGMDHSVSLALVRRLFDSDSLGKAPERSHIEKLVVFMKTAKHGAKMDLSVTARAQIDDQNIRISLKL